jgi:hypothetical protein
MRGPRVAGNPAAAGSPAPAGGTTAGNPAPGDPAAAAGTRPGATPRPGGRFLRLAREHWLLTVLLAAGLVLRAAAQIAYRPALIYIDSYQLPALITLPPAAALALTALFTHRRPADP